MATAAICAPSSSIHVAPTRAALPLWHLSTRRDGKTYANVTHAVEPTRASSACKWRQTRSAQFRGNVSKGAEQISASRAQAADCICICKPAKRQHHSRRWMAPAAPGKTTGQPAAASQSRTPRDQAAGLVPQVPAQTSCLAPPRPAAGLSMQTHIRPSADRSTCW